ATSGVWPTRAVLCVTPERPGDPLTHGVRPGRHDSRALLEVERSGAERLLDVEQIDLEAELAAEELRRGNVHRARRLERADRVDATGGEVAERERERTHDPQPVREVGDLGRVPGAARRPCRHEREDLDLVLR